MANLSQLTPQQCRNLIRNNTYQGPTSSLAGGYCQANLVVLPSKIAEDFQQFAYLNPKPCPILETLDAGETQLTTIADAQVTTDFPAYRMFNHTNITENINDITTYWQQDLVSFLLGCSYTTDQLLQQHNIAMKHTQAALTVAIYITNQATHASQYFSGPLAVTMRSIKRDQVEQAIAITNGYPLAHGKPIHVGDPKQLGINDITKPVYGTYFPIEADEVPVFWACGITPQLCAQLHKINLMMTHKPGHMLICDIKSQDLYNKKTL